VSKSRPRTLFQDLDIDAPHVTEARRILQILSRGRADGERRVYLVTSACGGEGKSTICSMLALVAARIFHKKTLVIDGDMHRPTLHKLLGLTQQPGLFEALRTPESEIIAPRATPLPLLFALPSGIARGPIAGAYEDSAFRTLLEKYRSAFDLIFIDAAPAVPAVEPILMAEHADAILIVAMAGRTPAALARRLKQILTPVASKIAGVILNNAAEELPYYHDARYYGYKAPTPRRVKTPPPVDRSTAKPAARL
jgi:succinoglycan biosynthesis transport protein ExoP